MKAYGFCLPAPHWGEGNVCGFLIREDGELLATHISSGPGWAQHDIKNHANKHPEYDYEWIEDHNHIGLTEARRLNREREEPSSETSR